MLTLLVTAARGLAGMVAATLPRRYWTVLDDYVPASRAAFPAALLTLLAGAALGITGYIAYLEASVGATNDAFLAAATRAASDEVPPPSGLAVLSLFTFLFLTPHGVLATYLGASGVVRTLGTQFDDPHGDVVLTVLDAAARRLVDGMRRVNAAGRQRRREGPEVADRVVRGSDIGLAAAELVICSGRPKDGWTPGTVVFSDRGEFRILEAADRVIDGRLRHLYALARHGDLEVIRRSVRYEFRNETPPGDSRS